MTPAFCGGNSSAVTDNRISLIRADFTVCALPANSLRYFTLISLSQFFLYSWTR
jgi:hypothetical protein